MNKKYQGRCHCQRVTFEVESNLQRVGQCNCSLCRKKNATMLYMDESKFTLLSGEQYLCRYRFNTEVAEHFFCQYCGIYTHHKPRTQKHTVAVNLNCLSGVDHSSFEIAVIDGAALSLTSKVP